MKLRYFLLTVIALCGVLSAQAQTLVIYDARIEMGEGPEEHRLIVRIPGEGFTIMDEYCNILTGREQGTFTFSRRDKENIFFDVEVSYQK